MALNYKTDEYDMLVAEMDRLERLSAATLTAFFSNQDDTSDNAADD